METGKRILTKEKKVRQPIGQSSSTPFVNIQDGYNSGKKVVSFDTQDRLDDKIDRLTSMMSKLTTHSSSQYKPFKHNIYQGKGRGQAGNYYNQDRHQGRYRSNSANRRMSYRGKGQYRQHYRGRSQYDQNYRDDFRKGIFRGIQNYILEVDIKVALGMIILEEVEIGLEKDNIQVTL